jgi:predicted PurR-regulated permease PerM
MDIRNSTITITTGTIVRTLLVLVLFALVYYLRDLALIILTAVVLSSAMEPAIVWLRKRGLGRLLSVILIYMVVLALFAGGVFFFVPPLLNDMLGFLNRLPDDLRNIDFTDILNNSTVLTNPTSFSVEQANISDTFGQSKEVIQALTGNFLKTTGAIFGGLLSFILIVVLSFYFAVLETGVDDFLRIVTPVRYQDYVVNLWKRAQMKIGLWMQGQVLLGVIVGVLVYLGLTIIGVPYAFFLAILAFVFELIPVFGPIIAAVPAVILGFDDGGLTTGLFVIGLYLIIQQFENHLIYPLVVRKVVGVPPILVIIALIVGAKLAGFLGILLSVPVSAALKEFVDDIQRKKDDERKRMSAAN